MATDYQFTSLSIAIGSYTTHTRAKPMTKKIEFQTDVKMVDIKLIKPYANNAKKHPKEQIEKLSKHIEHVGWDQPIVVDENNIILKGHGRLLAAKALKLDKVPVVVKLDLSETQKKSCRIADNKLAETEWDFEFLKHDLDFLKTEIDLTDIGFDLDFLENGGEPPKDESIYTAKVEAPIYEITGEKPTVLALTDSNKTIELIRKINNSQIPDDIKQFLQLAAYRHTVFDYTKIAEFYAHSDKDVQNLMEDSALIIIDYNKAIENGFVKLTGAIDEETD